MDRRNFVKLGAAAGAGAVLAMRGAVARPALGPGVGVVQGEMVLPESPGFATKHLLVVLLGGGARKRDVLTGAGRAPHQYGLRSQGTVFTEDYGETASLHGYMVSEVLSGRASTSQRPLYPTWNEYVRKRTGAPASDFWMLQGASYYRAWTWDVKHYSRHPDFGIRYGATSLTANKLFRAGNRVSPRELVERHVEGGLGHTERERARIEEFLAALLDRSLDAPAWAKRPRAGAMQRADLESLSMAGSILKAFKPRIVTVQVLGLDDAHAELGPGGDETGVERYLDHLEATDELIGALWDDVQADPYLRRTTALVVRPDCGRDGEVDACGQLGHTPGNEEAHTVWTMALGPDFEKGRLVRERVQRRDLAPTLTYLMSGAPAEHATGHVRTQAFRDAYGLPGYVSPSFAEMAPAIDWESSASPSIRRRA